ncbi:formate dehydrogenase [Brevibacterium paucivorans]|uniref:Formate dehydrogenase n=3 Tax=Brevibacterium paucivorans TaxID=170994 RepID=A0A2N6VNI9_9MICO|nr:formate dehydrogenase [Brevibacterium paucivorans]
MANADCIVIQGSNMAEAHPVGFQWVTEAKKRGARVIHIDPRFSRTSALADKYVPIRAGSDIVFLGALIRWVIENDAYFAEYVKAYTNAATIINEDYRDTEDLDGLFSGFDKDSKTYDQSSWAYEIDPETGRPATDPTYEHPRTVFQILKRHYARYTPELVEQMCGIKREDFEYVARSITQNSGRERTTCFAYAVGWTQHSMGTQFIRTAAILQLLLGNMGRPGGGIMALRGHATIQGASDIPTLFHLLPGYLPMPKAGTHDTLDQYLGAVGDKKKKGFWANGDAYAVSLLKSWWGDKATPENDFAYDYLPRINGPHGTYQSCMLMLEDKVDGYFLLGQNPAVGSANGRMQRMAMSHLKWLVVRDFNMIESATWWKEGPEIETGELRTEDIGTEVFFMPAANHTEKAGTFTQTQRLVQWRHQAITPPGDATSDLEFLYDLGNRIRAKLADSTDPRDRPLLDLTWDYPVDEHGEPDASAVLAEINGFHLDGPNKGEPLANFNEMRADGTTSGGCWIYTGVFADGVNHAANRKPGQEQDIAAREWGWAWPANRRMLYNRASADPQGKPWSERKKYVWWDQEQQRWTGHDIPDFPADRAPDYEPPEDAVGPAALAGDDPFVMQADGKGWLFAPTGVVDGPMPTHYEPPESAIPNPLYDPQNSPARMTIADDINLYSPGSGEAGKDVYPHVFTTYRLTEHHTAGGMSRWLPYLAELQPEMFCEVSPELAELEGLTHGEWATLITPRSAIEARVMVSERFTPLDINGRTVHQIGLPYHWAQGSHAVVSGDSANDLIGVTMDPNAQIQESKSIAVAIKPGRRPRGEALRDLVDKYRAEAGVTLDTGHDLPAQEGVVPPPGEGPAPVEGAEATRDSQKWDDKRARFKRGDK